jgi:hypothetical protein
MNELMEPLEGESSFGQYLKIEVMTMDVDHEEFLGFFETKLIRLIRIVEKKNTYNQFDPNKLDHLVCLRPILDRHQMHKVGKYEKGTIFYFGIYTRRKEGSGEEPNFQQIKNMMQRAINAFIKEIRDGGPYQKLIGKQILIRLD